MSEHFTSILRVAAARCESSEEKTQLSFDSDGKTVTLPAPPTSSTASERFIFDEVYTPSANDQTVYRDSVKKIVEGTLLGYNGTVISVGVSESEPAAVQDAIGRASEQIFHCVNKSKSSGSAANLVVNCSFIAVTDEKAYDLLTDLADGDTTEVPSPLDTGVQASVHEAKSTSQVLGLLQRGSEKEDKLAERLLGFKHSEASTRLHHTILSLTVEFSHFGSMNAPISGTLSFVRLSSPHSLACQDQYQADGRVKSLLTLAEVVDVLTPHESVDDRPALQQSMDRKLYSKSLLTRLLQDAFGGNCKTVFMCNVTDPLPVSSLPEVTAALQFVSRARHIHNRPNKRDLAERALMSAYMRQLRKQYSTVGCQEGEGGGITRDTDHDSTEGERQHAMELAATALAQAVSTEETELGDCSDGDIKHRRSSRVQSPPHVSPTTTKKISVVTKMRVKTPEYSSKVVSASGVTIDALVGVLQDPDRGVPRALETRLKDVKIRRDVGALFSGADIVEWMLANVVGVESENDAVTLGQVLVDDGAIFHSEGSMVFANSDSLFYYAREARLGQRMLSPEEIQALLSHAREPDTTNITSVPVTGSRGAVGEDSGVCEELREKEGKIRGEGEGEEERGVGDGQSLGFDSPTFITRQQVGMEGEVLLESSGFDPMISAQETDQWSPYRPCSIGSDSEFQSPAHHSGACGGVGEERPNSHISQSPTDHSGACGGVGEERPNSHVSVESWMKADTEEEELVGGGGEATDEDTVSGNPNTAPLQSLPNIHTLENSKDYLHPLHMAVAVGKQPGVIKHLIMMFGVDQIDEHGRTPLMFAALGNKRASCSTLIDCGANCDVQDKSGLTALHVACYHGAKEATRVLLNKKASVVTVDRMGHTALHWSCVPESTACLQLLLHYMWPSGLKQADSSGLTAFHWAIFYNHPHHLKLLLKKCTEDMEVDSFGRTLLTYSIEREPPASECINVLLECRPHLLTQQDANGRLPLHVASIATSSVPLSILVTRPPKLAPQIEVNCVDSSLRTPLHYAAAANHLSNVQILLSVSADRYAVDHEGKTPLDYAELLEDGAEMVALLQTPANHPRPHTSADRCAGELTSHSTHSLPSHLSSQTSPEDPSKVCTLL